MSLPRLILPAMLILALSPAALAQSTAASEASAYSIAPSVEVAHGLLSLVPVGSELVVEAIRPVAGSVELVLVSAVTGASIVLEVGAEVVRAAGLALGTTLVVTAVSAGFLLSVGAEVIAFVPDAITHGLIHHAELHR